LHNAGQGDFFKSLSAFANSKRVFWSVFVLY
jgi:hypothetical protein